METAMFVSAICSGILVGWALLGLLLRSLRGQFSEPSTYRSSIMGWLGTGIAFVGAFALFLGYFVVTPMVRSSAAEQDKTEVAKIPPYDYKAWHAVPVQHDGRTKPFESACAEISRQVTGRTKFEREMFGFKGHDPVAMVLSWMFTGPNPGPDGTDWEDYPFILCDHHELRRLIFLDKFDGDEGKLTDTILHAKYVSPRDLRQSGRVEAVLAEIRGVQEKFGDKYNQHLKPVQRKAEEVSRRLHTYETIRMNGPRAAGQVAGAELGALVGWGLDPATFLSPAVPLAPVTINKASTRIFANGLNRDPFHLVAMDRVPNSSWFSMGNLGACLLDEDQWRMAMRDRLARMPQEYVQSDPARAATLKKFQEAVKAGTAVALVDELETTMAQESEAKVAAFLQRNSGSEELRLSRFEDQIVSQLNQGERSRIVQRLQVVGTAVGEPDQGDLAFKPMLLANIIRETLDQRDQELLQTLRQQVRQAKLQNYHPEDMKFALLHLNFLEAKYPNLYRESEAFQTFPANDARATLASYDAVRAAYQSGDAEKFQAASKEYFEKLGNVSAAVGDYPGGGNIPLEMRFNRIQPFMWGWVIMALACLFFIVSKALDSGILYRLGWLAFLGSLAFQFFGFYCRVSISGRAPVTNMYETVVFVACMSALFAMVLELIYRKTFIIMAGALVATLGLVLADQVPLVLDPKISPLVPVLRSNYWLIVHVLTIVASYAGGTLAWGMGNLTLTMMAFREPRKDVLKTLSQFTYRAIQIAVFLLATGTFLGGWWAAESWGRFWGWDPKEVWALIALVAYVIPLHARYIGWVKDFGLAVAAVVCYAAIVGAWYGVNFVLGAGLHSYGFGGGGPYWVFLAGLLNLLYVLICSMIYLKRQAPKQTPARQESAAQLEEALA